MPTALLERARTGPAPQPSLSTSIGACDAEPPTIMTRERIGGKTWRVLRLGDAPEFETARFASYEASSYGSSPDIGVSTDAHLLPALAPTTPRVMAPEPAQFAQVLVVAVLEVYAGIRPAPQLARWFTPPAFETIRRQAALKCRLNPGSPHRTMHPISSRASRPNTTTAEATVVIREGERVRAVALRLKAHRSRWRATEFTLL